MIGFVKFIIRLVLWICAAVGAYVIWRLISGGNA